MNNTRFPPAQAKHKNPECNSNLVYDAVFTELKLYTLCKHGIAVVSKNFVKIIRVCCTIFYRIKANEG